MKFHPHSLAAAAGAILVCALPQSSAAPAPSPPALSDSSLGVMLMERGYTSVDIKKSYTGHPHIVAEINGQSVVLIVDTGSPTTVLDRARSSRLGLSIVKRNVNAASIGASKVSADIAELGEFKIGSLEMRKWNSALMDLSIVNTRVKSGGEADGIIGADVLTSYKAVIDYGAMKLYLSLNK